MKNIPLALVVKITHKQKQQQKVQNQILHKEQQ